MKIIQYILFFSLLHISQSDCLSQTLLKNPSFEDAPSDATIPQDWLICSPQTTPDILPGFWGVYNNPQEGSTYVGLISRPDGSFESLGQRLLPALQKNQCYRFNLALAHSKTYAAYNKPVKIRIWISQDLCERQQMVYESDFIENTEWQTHQITFTAKKEAHYITIEVYHPDLAMGIKGNVLIDHISAILNCGRA